MLNEISQDGSDLIAIQDVQDSIIKITKITDSKYEEWEKQLEREKKYLNRLLEDEIEERQSTLKSIKDLENKISEYENYLRKLVVEINRVKDYHSKRLEQVKILINNGEIEKAREFYFSKRVQIIEEKDDTSDKNKALSKEFLMMALLGQSDYGDPRRFEKVNQDFNYSIECSETVNNLFQYAMFLFDHNYYEKAKVFLQRILENYGEELSPNLRVITLNGLGIVYKKENDFDGAEKVFLDALEILRKMYEGEKSNTKILANTALVTNSLALLYSERWDWEKSIKNHNNSIKIWRKLCKTEQEIYLPYLAVSLNNLGLVYKNSKKYHLSEIKHLEAITIRRKMASQNANLYLQDLANSLVNLAILYRVSSDLPKNKLKAKHNLFEALEYFKNLSDLNPERYLFSLSKAYLNLGNIYYDLENNVEAEKNYLKSLEILYKLLDKHQQTFLLEYSRLTITLAIFYQNTNLSKEDSIIFALRTITTTHPTADVNPDVKGMRNKAVKVLMKWGFSAKEIEDMIDNEVALYKQQNTNK